MAMATTELASTVTNSTLTEQTAVGPVKTGQVAPRSRYNQMVERMRGMGSIIGDILNPDPETWTCEIE